MPSINNDTLIARCTQRQAAVTKYVPAKGSITVHSQAYTQTQIESVYQASVDARQTLVSLRGQVAAALLLRDQADATMNAFDQGMEAWVATTFGPKSQQSVDFGYSKKAPPVQPVAVKASAQVKAKATRTVRGTLGPKERLKVTVASVAAAAAAQAAPPTGTPAVTPPAALAGAPAGAPAATPVTPAATAKS